MKECEWCGHDHQVTSLCTKRPTWGRRGFLALCGAAVVGAAVDPAALVTPDEWEWIGTIQFPAMCNDAFRLNFRVSGDVQAVSDAATKVAGVWEVPAGSQVFRVVPKK